MKKLIFLIAGLALAISSFSQQDLPASLKKGLIFAWDGSEWGGNRDAISGVKGTATDTYNVMDRQGGGGSRYVSFDGVNDVIMIPDQLPLQSGTGDLTLIWAGKIIDGTTTQTLISKGRNGFAGGSGTGGYSLSIENNILRFEIGDGTHPAYQSAYSYTDNTWIAIILIVDRDTGFKLYINGSSVYEGNGAGSGVTGVTGSVSAIGSNIYVCNDYNGYYPCRSDLSFFGVFNYALSYAAGDINHYSTPDNFLKKVDQGATGFQFITGDNSTFASDTGWWTIDGATITGGVLSLSNVINKNVLFKELLGGTGLAVGEWYDVNFNISNSTGTSGLYFGSSFDAVNVYKTNGNYSLRLKATSSNIIVFAEGVATLDLDNLTITRAGCVLSLTADGLGRNSTGVLEANHWSDLVNGIEATLSGATLVIPPASNLGATYFFKSTSNLLFPNNINLTFPNTEFSYSARVTKLESGKNILLANKRSGSYYEYIFYINSSDNLLVYLYQGGTNSAVHNYAFSTTIPLNAETHVCFTYANGVLNLYINGSLFGTSSGAGDTFTSFSNTEASYSIGTVSTDGTSILRKIKHYNRCLSAEEVKVMFDTNN